MNVPFCSLLVDYIYWHIRDSCLFCDGSPYCSRVCAPRRMVAICCCSPVAAPNCPDSPRVEWKEAEQLVWSAVAASALLATWQRHSSAYEAADTLSHAVFLSTPVAQFSIKPLIISLPFFILFSLFPFSSGC